MFFRLKKIQLLSAYDVSRSYLNAGETLGERTINSNSVNLRESTASLLRVLNNTCWLHSREFNKIAYTWSTESKLANKWVDNYDLNETLRMLYYFSLRRNINTRRSATAMVFVYCYKRTSGKMQQLRNWLRARYSNSSVSVFQITQKFFLYYTQKNLWNESHCCLLCHFGKYLYVSLYRLIMNHAQAGHNSIYHSQLFRDSYKHITGTV